MFAALLALTAGPAAAAVVASLNPVRPDAGAEAVAALGLPAALTVPTLESLLQDFVNAEYGRAFLRLGEEADFDHGHLLLDAAGHPIAILYHTQELAKASAGAAVLDPLARNWIEWIDSRKIEDARRYERKTYPATATWDWFRMQRLPLLQARHTILDKMLDPNLLGSSVTESRQWVFTRRPCSGSPVQLRVRLPTKEEVCLALSRY